MGDCVCIVDSVFIGFGVSPSADGVPVGPKDVPLLDIVYVVFNVVVDISVLGIGFGVSGMEIELTVVS